MTAKSGRDISAVADGKTRAAALLAVMIDTAHPHVRKILVLNDSAQLNAFQLSSL